MKYRIDKNGCWIWLACKPGAYGPYRHFFAKYNGDIPIGMEVMHTCDNKACVNPAHLVLGTHVENMADSSGQGQTKKLLAGLIKEKHFAGAHFLYHDKQDILKKLGW